MTVLELQPLAQLTNEFRLSMRRLFRDLCRELETDYADVAAGFALPLGLFELLGPAIKADTSADWKVVGWIEGLNDLVYFLDILQQWKDEPDPAEFAEQLFAECQEKFFENSYLNDLFPQGRPHVAGLEKRLVHLCQRLSREVTQEALCLDPAVFVKWCRKRHLRRWEIRGNLSANYERAEEAGTLSIGMAGDRCVPPPDVVSAMKQSPGVSFRVEATGVYVRVGRLVSPLWTGWGTDGQWHWKRRSDLAISATRSSSVTIGPTLVYGKDRQPRTVTKTEPKQVARISRAWTTIEAAWPQGYQLLTLLTSRIVPLKAKGVVSFSYRHRPGLSFINCFDRDNLDLIDDLIHENSHHHLNLLLRKHVMYHGDHHQQIFYSPWRRSLRPLRGILHATFTFTMGALLFERLSAWSSERGGAEWKKAGLTTGDVQRARFRCLEEVESVRYSLQDLHYADRHLGWLTGSGRRMVGQLAEAVDQVRQSMAPHQEEVMRSKFGPSLRSHVRQLQQARQAYGPVRLGKV